MLQRKPTFSDAREPTSVTALASRPRLFAGLILLIAAGAPCSLGGERTDCNPQRWRDAMQAFRTADEQQPPSEGALLFVGSSSIRLWDLAKWFPDRQTVNRGFGGSEICDSNHYFDLLIAKHRPRLVVLYAGDNDVAGGKSAKTVHEHFRQFVVKAHDALPETPVLFVAIKPSIARWKLAATMADANARIAEDCRKDKLLTFVDVWQPMLGEDGKPRAELFVDDGLHLNEEGYKLWTRLVSEHLRALNRKDE